MVLGRVAAGGKTGRVVETEGVPWGVRIDSSDVICLGSRQVRDP